MCRNTRAIVSSIFYFADLVYRIDTISVSSLPWSVSASTRLRFVLVLVGIRIRSAYEPLSSSCSDNEDADKGGEDDNDDDDDDDDDDDGNIAALAVN